MKEKLELFRNYVSNYNIEDELIKIKIDHTFRVVDFCTKIGRTLSLNEEELLLAQTIGLLHDIARFKQATEYHIFDDSKSFDHGDYALEILGGNEIVKKISSDVNINILKKAIQYHNKIDYDHNLDAKTILFCQIIRDADKLDILNLSIQNQISNKPLDMNMSDRIYSDLMNFHIINFKYTENKLDKRLASIGYIFDLNFNYSFKYIIDHGVFNKLIDKLIKFSPQETKRLEKIRINTLKYIERRLMSC